MLGSGRTDRDPLALLLLEQPLPPLLDALKELLDDALGRRLVLVLDALDLCLVEPPRARHLVLVEQPDRDLLVGTLEREAVQREEVRDRVQVGNDGVGEGEGGGQLADGEVGLGDGEDGRGEQLVGCAGVDLGQVVEDPARGGKGGEGQLPVRGECMWETTAGAGERVRRGRSSHS